MSTYLITGATSGLGFQVALRLAGQGDNRLILPVRDHVRGEALRQKLNAAGNVQVSTPLLDLASLKNVTAFLKALNEGDVLALDGVLLNAGTQSANRIEFTEDGHEVTFAVNHLANYLLMRGLLRLLASRAIVGWTASGTHDPKETSARLTGFRGAQYTDVTRLAMGNYGENLAVTQACRDAYATSKFCEIVSARIFAQRYPEAARFFSFDPGLMPGTGLARKQPRAVQWVWNNLLPRLVFILPGTSTPARSGAFLTGLLTDRVRGSYNGAYFNYTGKQVEPAWPATESWVAADLEAGSEKLLLPFLQGIDPMTGLTLQA